MNAINQEIRDSVYFSSTGAIKYLYSHPNSGAMLKKIAQQNKIDAKYYEFSTTVGDIILGFYKVEDTVPLLQQELELDPKTAALLGADVLEFLAPLSDPNWQPPAEETDEGLADSNSFPITEQPRSIPVKAPATAVENPTSLYTTPQPIHTFATDMAAVRGDSMSLSQNQPSYTPTTTPEPVYQSSQQTRATIGDMPSYESIAVPLPTKAPESPARPRWSTEL